MHRSLTALIAAGLLLLAMAVPASAAKPEATGPACADISVSAAYATDGTGRTVLFAFETAAPSCSNVTYTGYVLSADGLTQLASGWITGDGTTEVFLAVPVPGDHTTVCVYATSSSPGGKVFDRAPDSGCSPRVLDGGAGAQKMI